MDDWAFLSLAKIKADSAGGVALPLNVQQQERPQAAKALSKIDAALALDYETAEQNRKFRRAVSLAVAVLVNVAFFGGIELQALSARTPSGEVIVAELDSAPHEHATASLQ